MSGARTAAVGGLRARVGGIVDLPGVLRLVEAAYRGPGDPAAWTTESHLLGGQRTDPAAVRELMVSVRDVVLVAGDHRDPEACCTVGTRDDGVQLGMFAVRPTHQGGGIGGAMLATAERHAVDRWGARTLHLRVIAQRGTLIAWYERRGYARTGETMAFPYGDERFGVPRREDLHFVGLRRDLA